MAAPPSIRPAEGLRYSKGGPRTGLGQEVLGEMMSEYHAAAPGPY